MSTAKVGECRNPEKVRYYVKREAENAAEFVGRHENVKLRVYACGMHFHLTSKMKVFPGDKEAQN